MTGPEHFRESERLLALSKKLPEGSPAAEQLTADAQVHATLAGAAAIALQIAVVYHGDTGEIAQWSETIGTTNTGKRK